MKRGETITMPSPIDIGVDLSWSERELADTYHDLARTAIAGGVQAVYDVPDTQGGTFSIVERTNGNVSAKLATSGEITDITIGAYACMNRSYFEFYNLNRLVRQASGLYVNFGNKPEYRYKYSRKAINEWMTQAKEAGVHAPIIIRNLGRSAYEAVEHIASHGHFVHLGPVATEEDVEWVEYFQRKYGENFSSSVSVNHLIMTSEDVDRYGSNARMDPPLGTPSDRSSLMDAYAEGYIDILQSGHKPMSMAKKVIMEMDYPMGFSNNRESSAQGGASCLDYMVPLMMGKVISGEVSRTRLADSWYTQPKRMLGLAEDEMNRNIDIEIAPHFVEAYEIEEHAWNVPYVHWRMPASVIGFSE